MSPARLINKETSFSDRLLPQLVKAFSGLYPYHLQHILGKRTIHKLLVRQDNFLVKDHNSSVAFDLLQNIAEPAIASIRGHITAHPPKEEGTPNASLQIESLNLNELGVERGVRIFWDNHIFNLPRGEKANDLFLEQIQVSPLEGEFFDNGREKTIQPYRGEKLKLEGEGLGSQDKMHVINLVSDEGGSTIRAVNQLGEPYNMIEVKFVEGDYEIIVHADDEVFNSAFTLVIPQHIKIDQKSYQRTVKMLNEI